MSHFPLPGDGLRRGAVHVYPRTLQIKSHHSRPFRCRSRLATEVKTPDVRSLGHQTFQTPYFRSGDVPRVDQPPPPWEETPKPRETRVRPLCVFVCVYHSVCRFGSTCTMCTRVCVCVLLHVCVLLRVCVFSTVNVPPLSAGWDVCRPLGPSLPRPQSRVDRNGRRHT